MSEETKLVVSVLLGVFYDQLMVFSACLSGNDSLEDKRSMAKFILFAAKDRLEEECGGCKTE